MRGTAVIGRKHSIHNSMIVRKRGVTRMLRGKRGPTVPYRRAVGTGKYCLVPNIVSSRMRFHSPKLARGTSVSARDQTTTTKNMASVVSVPGAGPRAAALSTLGTGFSLLTRGYDIGCSYCFKTAGGGCARFSGLSGGHMYKVGLFVKSDAKGVLMSGVGDLLGVFGKASLLVTTRYRGRRAVGGGARGCMGRCVRGCPRRCCRIRRRALPVNCRTGVHSVTTYCRSSRLTMHLTHVTSTHLRVLRVSATERLSLFSGSVPLRRGEVATRTYISRLLFSSSSCLRLNTHVGYGPSVGAGAGQSTLHRTIGSGLVSIVTASRTPRLLGRGRKKPLGTVSNVPVVRFSLIDVLRLIGRNVFAVRGIIRGVYRTPTRVCGVRGHNFVHPNCRTSLMLIHPSTL